ncbi:MAG: thermonuclease family protein [Deltaproteobacteria bacterium]|nr:thermonuclease family protein [Deltaproteobacteria bacterium]
MGIEERVRRKEPKNYQSLLAELSGMYESVVGLGVRSREQALVQVFWEMGHRIVNVLQMDEGYRTAHYGANVVERLGKDLTQKYGKGFGRSNMFYMRQFALEMERSEIESSLTWTHYRALLGVGDKTARERLMRQAVDEQMKCATLRQLVRTVHREDTSEGEFPLMQRRGQLGVVKVESDPFNAEGHRLLNLGFNIRCVMKLTGVRNVAAGELIRVADGQKGQRVDCAEAERYCYEGRVIRVVDGDTLVLRLCLANGSFVDERIRLRGVDAAEVNTSDGRETTRFVERRVRRGAVVLVHTFGGDIYGRYVGDVFYGSTRKWLNRELVMQRAAKFMDMKV